MKKFIAVNTSGDIQYTVSHAQDSFYEDNPTLGDLTFHEVPMDLDDNGILATTYWDGELKTRSIRPSLLHVWDNTSLQWNINLADAKTEAWTRIKSCRNQAENAGFFWDGSEFDSDQISQVRIMGAVSLATNSPSFTCDWILKDNATRTLDRVDMQQVGNALSQHIATQFAKSTALRSQINLASTGAEVDAAVWCGGLTKTP